MVKGRCAKYERDPDTDKLKPVATATAYAWLIWVRDRAPEPFQWIADQYCSR
jgi:hypothetical protein